jgi:hypothetical protein
MDKPRTTGKGKSAGASLRKSAKQEERKIEARKGSQLLKGEQRFEERSKSSDGKSAGAKQR